VPREGQRPIRFVANHGSKNLGYVWPWKRAAAAEKLVEHHTKRPDIGALVDRLASRCSGGM
jgi:hypothetical protein